MTRLEDVIETEEYGKIEIWSQDEVEYFVQDVEAYERKYEKYECGQAVNVET